MRLRRLGQQLASYRRARQLNQEALAQRVNLSRSTISLIERGHAPHISISVLQRLATALDVTLGDLLEYESSVPVEGMSSPLSLQEVTGTHGSAEECSQALSTDASDTRATMLYSLEVILSVLAAVEAGEQTIPAVCQTHGITQALFYQWQSDYGAMSHKEVQRLKRLEHEHAQLKRLLAERVLELDALLTVITNRQEFEIKT